MSTEEHILRFDLPDDFTVKSHVSPVVQGFLRRSGIDPSMFRVEMRKRLRVILYDPALMDTVIAYLREEMGFTFKPELQVADIDEAETKKESA